MERRPKSITYSESRTINIGDYESIKCELRYSTEIEKINEIESTVKIWEQDTISLDEDKKAFEDSVSKAMSRVRQVLNAREADIRIRTAKFTEHDTGRKALFLKLASLKNWYKKQDKFKVDADEIDEFEDGEQ